MRRVEQIMGLPVSVDIPEYGDKTLFEAVFERLRQIDNRFSTYKTDSEVSRFGRDELGEDELSSELKSVLSSCREAGAKTGGYFSAWAAGDFDPSGYVKGWAIAQAGEVIEAAGRQTYCIGAGGDILARSSSKKIWNIGIQDPQDKSKILNTLSIANGAVCTSGSYERGSHIINPKNQKAADGMLSVSVSGPDIIWADVLATAVFAMGPKKGRRFMKGQPDYTVMIIKNPAA